MNSIQQLIRRVTPGLAVLALLAVATEAAAQVTVRIGENMTVQARGIAIALEGTIEATGTFDTRGTTITFTQTDGSGGIALGGGLAVTFENAETFEGTTINGPVQLEGALRLAAAPGASVEEGTSFTVLTCAGGCSGTFSTIEAPFAVDVRYGANTVEVTVLESIGTASEVEGIPGRYALHAPYPNPFSGATQLQVELEAAANVRVEAFDLLGRRVGRIAEGLLAAGSHRLVWTPDALGAGTYFLRVQVGREAAQVWAVTLAR